jgi:hypothetical protein
MPPRYVIHVGPLKTASTYMQQCFTAVQPALQERGVYYPPELIDPDNKHMHMPVYAAMVRKQSEKLRPIFARINAEGHETVVLSCEHLIFLRPEEFTQLRDLIGVPDIQIVYVVRRWSDRIASLWNQSLFMGGSQTLPEFYLGLLDGRTPEYYRKTLGPKAGGYDIDYSLSWREHAAVFGRDAVRLFSYAAVTDGKSDVFERFCTDVLGMADVPTPKFLGDKRWASMPRDEAEILRALNAMYLKEHGETTVGLRNMIMWKRVPIDRAALGKAMEGETAELAIDDRAVHFDAPYARMTEFADRVVPGVGVTPGEVFERKKRQNAYAHQGWLVEPGVAEGLRALYEQMKVAMRKPA